MWDSFTKINDRHFQKYKIKTNEHILINNLQTEQLDRYIYISGMEQHNNDRNNVFGSLQSDKTIKY